MAAEALSAATSSPRPWGAGRGFLEHQKGNALLRHALKHAALAAALLIPTLAVVAVAPPAFASGSADVFAGDQLGMTSIKMVHDETGDPDCGQAWTSYYAATVTSSPFDAQAAFATSNTNTHYGPNSSQTVTFAWKGRLTSGCPYSQATTATLSFNGLDGIPYTQVTTSTIPATASGSLSVTLSLPNGAGQYYLGMVLNGNNEDFASTEATCCTEPLHSAADSETAYWSPGFVSAGYMVSLHDDRGTSVCPTLYPGGPATTIGCFDTDEYLLGKSLSMDRIYKSTWGAVPSSVTTDASHSVGVAYSEKWATSDSNFVAESSSTHLFQSVADGWDDTTGVHGVTNGLISQIQSLESIASTHQVPITFTLFHEPHEFKSSGSGVDVSSSEFTPTKTCTGTGSACFGTAAEYRAMYHHLESLVNQYGKDSYGRPWVKVMYIETDFNMSAQTSGVYLCPTQPGVGCADATRPANVDYDVLGPDLYNFYTFNAASWKEATDSTKLNTSGSAGLITLADNEQKHILVAEMGTHPGCPGGWNSQNNLGGAEDAKCSSGVTTETKNGWFQTLASGLTGTSTNAALIQKWFVGFIYFHLDGPSHDWQFVNRASTLNKETACPATWGSTSCWNGDIDTTGDHDSNGWGAAFVNNSSANNNHASWFVGAGLGSPADYRQALFF